MHVEMCLTRRTCLKEQRELRRQHKDRERKKLLLEQKVMRDGVEELIVREPIKFYPRNNKKKGGGGSNKSPTGITVEARKIHRGVMQSKWM